MNQGKKMKCVWCCFRTVVILAVCSARSLEDGSHGVQIEVPKCCRINETYDPWEMKCSPSNETVNYEHYYFDSNETHINTVPVKFTPKFYKQPLECEDDVVPLNYNEVHGFIYNASLIDNNSIIPPSKYCVYEENGGMVFLYCYKSTVNGRVSRQSSGRVISVYLPFLILSTMCYYCSAFIYWFILKVKHVHKKCFIGYSLSMGVTFSFLIALQTMSGERGCNVIGGLFFFSILSSFVWLACLCFDLIVLVRNFKEEPNGHRFLYYVGASFAFPKFFSLLTLLRTGIPEVPDSFMKPNGNDMCRFKDDISTYFFVPVGILMVSSLIFLGYNFHLMRQNRRNYRNHFCWLENKSKFMYMSLSCSLIWITSAIWIIDTAIRDMIQIGNPDVYDVIEALQGIFAVTIFVTNRYTRKEIYAKLCTGFNGEAERRERIGTLRWIVNHLSLKRQDPTEDPDTEDPGNEGVGLNKKPVGVN